MRSKPKPVRRRPKQSRHGAATVEFALVIPIILTFFFGTIEIANINYLRNLANDSAFQVARGMIVPGADESNVKEDLENLLDEVGVADATIVVAESTDSVTVTVTIPMGQNTWTGASFLIGRSIIEQCTLQKSFKAHG